MGRKDFEEKTKRLFPEYFKIEKLMASEGLNMAKACDKLGIAPAKFYNWRRYSPDFKPNKRGQKPHKVKAFEVVAAPSPVSGKLALIIGDASELGAFVRSYLQ